MSTIVRQTQECKVALIGAGYMAREHLRAFADIAQVRIVGIFSRTRERASALASEYNIPLVADSLDALYEQSRPDLVVITVNAHAVDRMVSECCRFPWVMLAEKPVGLNVASSRFIMQLAQEKQRRVYVALNRRFYASTQALVNGLLDDPDKRLIEVFDQQTPDLLLRMGKNPVEIKHLMFSNGIHVIDYLRMLGRGEIVSVVPIFPWSSNSETTSMVVATAIHFSSGDQAIYRCLWNAPGPWAVTVTTKQKRWELKPLEKLTVQNSGARVAESVNLSDIDARFKPGLRVQAEEAVKATLGLENKSIPLSEAHKTMELIAQIYEM